MSIVCGADFSESSQRAVRAAADLAVGMNLTLHLVHAVQENSDALLGEPPGTAARRAREQLQRLAEQARTGGARVELRVEQGSPDEVLETVAKQTAAQLVIVAALGHRRQGKWQVGSHAERIAHHSHVPVIVVRNAELFHGWVHKKRPLRVLLGIDMTESSEAALQWLANLRKFGPCDIIATHLYWPPREFARLGLTGIRSYIDPDPEVTKALSRDFVKRMQDTLGEAPARLRLEPHLGSLADRLALVADEEHVDLIVVGSHGRALPGRIVHGSVSHDVVRHARVSVACVPVLPVDVATSPRLDSVLVATDFSPLGNAAVALAYAAVADGGMVHLVHVSPDESGHSLTVPHDIFPGNQLTEAEATARYELLKLMPRTDSENVRTRVYVLRSNDAALAICQAAERLDAALICVGTHGQSGLARTLLGSVTSTVLKESKKPLLLARARAE